MTLLSSLSLSVSALSLSPTPFALHSLLLKFAHFVLHMLHVYDFVLYPNKSAEYMEINDQYNTQIVLYTLHFNESLCVCVCVSNETLPNRRVAQVSLHFRTVRVFCFRCFALYFSFFFYSDNFSYATNLHKKIKKQQQQQEQPPATPKNCCVAVFLYLHWQKGCSLLLLLFLLFLQLCLLAPYMLYSIYRYIYICKFRASFFQFCIIFLEAPVKCVLPLCT